jgi:hypothetical protein
MAVFDRSMAEPEGESAAAVGTERRAEPAAAVLAWGPWKRIGFRWLFTYLVLYLLPTFLSLLAYIPKGEAVYNAYAKLWQVIVAWVGKVLFHLEITVFPAGSGDTTYNYVEILCFAAVAAVVALLWTLLDRRRLEYARLHECLRVYVRLGLGMTMLSYGASKVIPTQFPSPSLYRLLQPYGFSSPMGLLWTFMGASPAYTTFAGASEMIGGLLLIARRTTLLGALVCMGVMGNVVMLNFCYDVPVKLYSSHLFLMAFFLAAPDLRRLADLLVFNRRVEPVVHRPLFARKGFHRAALVLRALFFVGLAVLGLYETYGMYNLYGAGAPKSPLYGIWNVDELAQDGVARPPLLTDEKRWRRVVFDRADGMSVQFMNDTRQGYVLKLDAAKGTLALSKYDNPAWKAALSYQRPNPGRLLLNGTLDGHSIRAVLSRADPAKLLLTHRGFRWINEYPFNR